MKSLFIPTFLIAQVLYISANCEVRLTTDVSQNVIHINLDHEFKNFEGFLDLDGISNKFNYKPYFDSTVSQRKLYSYYTHNEYRIVSLSAGLGFIRNKSKLKTGPMLFFRNDQFTEPHIFKGEYNNLVSNTLYLGLGLVNKINFKQKYVFENKCYINGSILNYTSFDNVNDTTIEEFESSLSPENIMTVGIQSSLLREFKFAGVGCGFIFDDYFRYYHQKEWDNHHYSKFFIELRLIFMKGYFREMKKELKKIFNHDNNSPENVVETK